MLPDIPEPEPWRDPVVEEIRQIREAHARRFDYDLDAIVADLRQSEEELRRQGWRIVDRSQQTEPFEPADSPE